MSATTAVPARGSHAVAGSSTPDVALVHDYLTQRGGAERVVLALARTFPDAPLHTSLYEPEETFPEFRTVDVRTLPLNRSRTLRHHHRLAFPFLAPSFSHLDVEAATVICSSSGWAHGASVTGRKIVYCYTPARWLYQSGRYLGEHPSALSGAALRLARPGLLRWDKRAAVSANRYLAISTVTRDRIKDAYGLDAEIVAPPHSIDLDAPRDADDALEPGFVLCVSRLLPYKNVSAIVQAFALLPHQRLVIVGSGPEEKALRALATANVVFAGPVPDARLRWLYSASGSVITSSYEDFGLTPIEAAAFGKPTAALRFGGLLDTVVEGETGVFFDRPEPSSIANELAELDRSTWDPGVMRQHAARFSEERFAVRIQEIVREVTP
jgi:glycosyltransferase involved in cell wall biosynthesis